MSSSSASASGLPKFPDIVCVLDIETSGRHSRMPDRADLAVVGIKLYTWDERQNGYQPGSYEHYTPTDLPALQQRLDGLPAPIVGHNLFGFDYRVLRRHLNLERVIEKSADTLHFLYEQSGGEEDGLLYSLDKLAKENFGEGKIEKGSTVPKLIEQGKIAEVLAYNERDCDLTFRVWWKMVSERQISVGEDWVEGFEDYELSEITYDFEEEDVSVLICATPRFTFATWAEQLERDGWVVMPPPERKRREKELERQRAVAREAADKRNSTMQEFIKQHSRDDIPRKYAHSHRDGEPGHPDLDEARALCERAGLPENTWSEGTIARLLGGDRIVWRSQSPEEGPDSLEAWIEAIKGTLVVLTAEGYVPHYYAFAEPGYDVVYLEGPPPPPPTLAQQYVDRMQERYAELDALFGPAGIGFQVMRIAVGVHPAYTQAMNSLHDGDDGYVVFQDGSYVFDTDETDLFELRPKVLTSEETAAVEVYIRDHPADYNHGSGPG